MLDRIFIKCSTRELANKLMKVFDDLGIKWATDNIASSCTKWEVYEKDTVYCISNNYFTFADVDYCKQNRRYRNYIWYTVEDFISKYTNTIIMTKKDIKPGMLVEIVNSKDNNSVFAIVMEHCGDKIAITERQDWYNLDTLSKNLRWESNRFSVQKIYDLPWSPKFILTFSTISRKLLWERKEPKEYTMQEIADKLGIPVEELRIKRD